MKVAIKIGCALLGAVFGFLLSLIAVELMRYAFSVAYGSYYAPARLIPGGVTLAALLTAWSAWKSAPTPERLRSFFHKPIDKLQNSEELRFWLAGTMLWLLILMLFVFGFDLFGRYWNREAWRKFWFASLGPPILGLVAIPIIRWARGQKNSDGKS